MTLLVALAGCFHDGGDAGCNSGNGLVGGNFAYTCRSAADVACDRGGTADPPPQVARSATFGLSYVGTAVVRPVSTRAVGRQLTWFHVDRPGFAGFVAEDKADLVDAYRLEAVEPSRLGLDAFLSAGAPAAGPTVDVEVGASVSVRAVASGTPAGGSEVRLAGALPVTWSTNAPTSRFDDGAPGLVVLQPSGTGTFALRASFEGRLEAELVLRVRRPGTDVVVDGGEGGDAGDAGDAGDGGAP